MDPAAANSETVDGRQSGRSQNISIRTTSCCSPTEFKTDLPRANRKSVEHFLQFRRHRFWRSGKSTLKVDFYVMLPCGFLRNSAQLRFDLVHPSLIFHTHIQTACGAIGHDI